VTPEMKCSNCKSTFMLDESHYHEGGHCGVAYLCTRCNSPEIFEVFRRNTDGATKNNNRR